MSLTSLELALLVLTVEFALIAGAITFVALRRGRQTAAAQVTQANDLVAKVDADETARRAALSAIFSETYRFDSSETERVVADFIERERAFYNAIIGVHLGRGGKTLSDVPAELTRVVAPWLRLTPKHMVSSDAIDALQTENSALNVELASTKRVLDELMAEYNAAFHKEKMLGASRAPTATEVSQAEALDEAGTPPLAPDLDESAIAEPDMAEEDSGEIIALDLDLNLGDLPEPVQPAQLTPHDLDELMENLDAEYKADVAAA
jgi:hypothetical protein